MVTETIARGAAVSISHLHHAFTLGKQTVPVLENISLLRDRLLSWQRGGLQW